MGQLLANLGWSKIVIGGLAVVVVGGAATAVVVRQSKPIRPRPSPSFVAQASPVASLAPVSSPSPKPAVSQSPKPITSSVSTAPASPSPSASAKASGLPPCATETATGCDKSNILANGKNSNNCNGTGTAMIGASPIDIKEISLVDPMGLMVGNHVTPIDHGYIYVKGAMEKPPREVAVKAPFDAIIMNVARMVRQNQQGPYDDYSLSLDATCTFRVRFSNLTHFAGGLGDKVGQLAPNGHAEPNYAVKEGELIGYTGLPTAYGIDVWVEDDNSTLTGFVNPVSYKSESWKTHMVDLFDYTKEPVKSQLLALDIREASPRFGKIDHDIDGKLIGNWFVEGSGGYGGKGGEDYPRTHLAIVPDGVDPNQIIVSFGNYQGDYKQLAVKVNTPNPADVDQSTGLVKYELGMINNYLADTGEQWNGLSGYRPHIRTRAGSGLEGTVLFQLTDKRKLKMEVFPKKAAADVSGFDDQAVMYER